MKSVIVLCFLPFIFFGLQPPSAKIKLDLMVEGQDSPKNGDGPSYYTYPGIKLKDEKYIFNLGSTGFCFFRINDKTILLRKTKREVTQSGYVDKYKGSGYLATLTIDKMRPVTLGDSVEVLTSHYSIREGTLMISSKTKRISFRVHGVSYEEDDFNRERF